MKTEDIDLQLRSEKVRNIVGEIPPAIMRYGIYIIILIVSVSLFCLFIIPIHEQYRTNIIIKSIPEPEVVTSPLYGKINYCVSNNSYVDKDEKIAKISHNETICDIYSKSSGEIILNNKNNSYLKVEDIVCEIIPEKGQLYTQALVPMNYINKDYKSFHIDIIVPTGESINGSITEIYAIPVSKNGEQFYKADIYIDKEQYVAVNTICKMLITENKGRLIDKILR